MDRARWLVAGIALAAIPIGLITGSVASSIWLFAAIGGGLLFVAFGRDSGRPQRRSEPVWQPAGTFRYVPSAGPTQAGDRGVAAALGRVEARWLVPGSLAFAVGIGFCLLELLFFGMLQGGYPDRVDSVVELLAIMAHPLAGMTVLAIY